MKKLIIFGVITLMLFAAVAFLTSYQNQQQAKGNPFGKERLYSETIDQLDNPLYQNIILPDELEEVLEADGDITVYFYSGQCDLCNRASPVVVPKAEELGVDLKMYNILEFNEGWNKYGIEGTPTIVHFKNGEESSRISGLHDENIYESFLQQMVLGNES